MGKSSPKAPDYTAAAVKTGEAQLKAIEAQTKANRPDIYTPWGSQTWAQDKAGDWTQNISLSPQQQAALKSQLGIQQGLSTAAGGLVDDVQRDFSTPFSWGGISAGGDRVASQKFQTQLAGGDSGDYRQKAQDAITKLQQPSLDRRRAAAETQLVNQGFARDSEAYKAAMQDVDDAEARANLAAIAEGRNESELMFGQDLSAGQFGNQARAQSTTAGVQAGTFNNSNRANQISEQQLKRGMSLQDLNALLSGQQVGNPSFQQGAQAGAADGVDYIGAASNQYNANLAKSNAENAQQAQTLGTAASIAAMFAFSDARLKQDVKTEGWLPSGLRVVSYRYLGMPLRHFGVMAQEALKFCPAAVVPHASGFLMVDYSKVN